jgi:enamine deaminase RidA (YjgF/YER057c/UK114 family)
LVDNIRFLNPPNIAKPPGYSHVVEVTGPGRIVYIAGQLGLDRDGKLVGGAGDFRAQTAQAFANLKAALNSVGATVEHIVKINNYVVDIGRNIGAFAKCAMPTSTRRRRPPAPPSACRSSRVLARCSRSRLW